MSLTSGEVFAGYTIQRLLGSDGIGEVYLALHPRLPRPYALKILAAQLTDDAGFRTRFDRDAQVAATLSHPHIVGMQDRGLDDGRLWVAMDYVEGTDTSRLIRDRFGAEMPLADVIAVITAVADALDYAHERELLHGDVKPANILLSEFDTSRRRILLADLGIPRPGGPVDGRADQYALAATAFHMLTGIRRPGRLAEYRPELARLDPVMSKALASDPSQRYPRCLDFAQALRRATDAQHEPGPVSTQVQMPMTTMPVQPAIGPPPLLLPPPLVEEWPRRRGLSRLLLPLILAVVLLAVSAFATTQFLRPMPQPSTAAPEWQPYVDTAKKFTETFTSLGAQSSEEDVQRILDGSTGEFRDSFLKQRESFIALLKAAHTTAKGTAKGAGLESIDESKAQVLVAIDQEVTNSSSPQQPRKFRFRLEVVKVDDALKVSKVDVLS